MTETTQAAAADQIRAGIHGMWATVAPAWEQHADHVDERGAVGPARGEPVARLGARRGLHPARGTRPAARDPRPLRARRPGPPRDAAERGRAVARRGRRVADVDPDRLVGGMVDEDLSPRRAAF